jgi:hypothetical protein
MKNNKENIWLDMRFIQMMNMGLLPTKDELKELLSLYKKLKHSISGMTDQHIDDYNDMLEEKISHPVVDYSRPTIKNHKKGIIYIIKSHDFYKIGRTQNLEQRLYSYKTQNPHIKLIFYKEVPDCCRTEKDLLFIFKSKQLRGEWFDLTDGDITWISERIN